MWIETQGRDLIKIGEEDVVRVEDGKLILRREIDLVGFLRDCAEGRRAQEPIALSGDGERAFVHLKNAISHNDSLVSFYVDQGRRS